MRVYTSVSARGGVNAPESILHTDARMCFHVISPVVVARLSVGRSGRSVGRSVGRTRELKAYYNIM